MALPRKKHSEEPKMLRLIETILAQDVTGNHYEIERYQLTKKVGTKIRTGAQFHLHKKSLVTYMGEGTYYLVDLNTEVKKISTNYLSRII
jgi:hypothetical protein